MARRALILIEGTRSNGPLYAKAAQRLGLHPITLSADPARYDYLAAEGIEAIRVDTDNLDALIRECSQLRANYDIAGITSALESVYAIAGKLALYFDLPGPNPTLVEQCCDKFTQRQLLAQAGVPVPAYRLVVNAADAESSASDIGLPVILKPAVGSSSSGVRLCHNVDELVEHTTYLLSSKYIWPFSPKHIRRSSPMVLVEEYVEGPQYIADIMGTEVVGITAAEFSSLPHFVYHECVFPAPLTDDEYKSVSDFSLRCLQALGLGWGPTCIEFRWTKRGPVVIEVNPRLAGTDPQLVQLAYGVDLVAEHIKLLIGDECDLRKRHSHTAAARFLIPDCDGTLDWIDGDARAAAVSGVAEVKLYVEPKTPIIRKGDDRDCLGCVIATSPSHAQTEAILQRAVDLISWSITPVASNRSDRRPLPSQHSRGGGAR
ncbi:ATP-grasp domain-containing protein [Mesorhizobium sp. M6A.T.Ce.TU.002.03.1.1]|uniref:ATP-grasp domain-containing protein n=1 Tax=Mesorhizobium sp. M6A.T.Ce.TU.002.03.1.1 TaxID=2496782 RepID=UPI000FCCDD4E|nr:acetyl-CoA carboxylase biotin carboxylase subunit family protein [Mesorhizobium sp. M6A.T.Ce.TU.002.03.1.1]RUU37173.1 ATP-grasp domain-containing protein [Mesorhizobium sp. M6A.T.Ce.TU.002.03.1.1]